MTPTPRYSVSVAAAIFDDSGENVLLIQRRDNGHWEPPGGVLELDETIEDGLRREVREETGVEIDLGPLTGIYKNMTADIVALVFAARALSSPSPSTPEAVSVTWTPIASLDELMVPAYAVRVRDAIAERNTHPAIRAHDGANLL